MKKITLIWVGKTQNNELKLLNDLYIKRLTPLVQLNIVELKEQKSSELNSKLKDEAKLIENSIPSGSKVILLDETGKQFTSKNFAQYIEKECVKGVNHFCFIIGSAYGFDLEFKQRITNKMAMSQMTLTHEMIRVFFLEQIYRAEMITRGTGYHH